LLLSLPSGIGRRNSFAKSCDPRKGFAMPSPAPAGPVRLVLFTRYPTPGEAKTRLIPAIGAEAAAAVHRRLSERTVASLRAAGMPVEIRFTGAGIADFEQWLGAGPILVPQSQGGLTERLIDAINPCPVIFFGADTPDLEPRHIAAAVAALSRSDVVIGPAADGGYYLIGLRRPLAYLFDAMPWSTDRVVDETCRRLAERDIRPELLETLHDCDTPQDLSRWPWLLP
jgi:hypothetical protein